MELPAALSHLPRPSTKRIALRISPAAERALKQGHPWIFDESISEQSHEGAPGDLAVIFDAHRRTLQGTDTDGYRLVHGENDGLPGLVVDRYADTLVMKLYTPAWIPHLGDFLSALDVVQQKMACSSSRTRFAGRRPAFSLISAITAPAWKNCRRTDLCSMFSLITAASLSTQRAVAQGKWSAWT
jgi:hypothetical protein